VLCLIPLLLSAAPTTACETPVGDLAILCTEVKLGAQEDPSSFAQKCEAQKGTSKAVCGKGAAATCTLGDTTLRYFTVAGKGGDALAGLLHGAQTSCFGHGGTFEPKPKPKAKAPTVLKLPALHASLQAPGDCEAEEIFGSVKVSCGGQDRPEVTLALARYTADEVQPKKPEDVTRDLKREAPNSTVTELEKKAGKSGAWRVKYAVASKHGAAGFGLQEVREFGGERILCTGTAWSRSDLDATAKMCANLAATP